MPKITDPTKYSPSYQIKLLKQKGLPIPEALALENKAYFASAEKRCQARKKAMLAAELLSRVPVFTVKYDIGFTSCMTIKKA